MIHFHTFVIVNWFFLLVGFLSGWLLRKAFERMNRPPRRRLKARLVVIGVDKTSITVHPTPASHFVASGDVLHVHHPYEGESFG